MEIKELVKEAHQTAKEKGFWDEKRNNSELLMLIVTELGEACEALRKNHRQTCTKTVEYGEGVYEEKDVPSLEEATWKKNTFEDEIADVFIRLGDLCAGLDIDIEWHIKKKMEYNRNRPYKHGKQF